MTLGLGNRLAKVQKDANGNWVLITGEAQHIFEVEQMDSSWYLNQSTDAFSPDYAHPIQPVTLRVVE